MKLKVGEYVRCKNGRIAQITDIENETVYFDKYIYSINGIKIHELEKTFFDFIVKHSKKIEDLIGPSDIILYKLNEFNIGINIVSVYRDGRSGKEYLGVKGFRLHQVEILEIYTKEQLKSISYKIEDRRKSNGRRD